MAEKEAFQVCFTFMAKQQWKFFLKCKRGSLLKQGSGACDPEGDEDDV